MFVCREQIKVNKTKRMCGVSDIRNQNVTNQYILFIANASEQEDWQKGKQTQPIRRKRWIYRRLVYVKIKTPNNLVINGQMRCVIDDIYAILINKFIGVERMKVANERHQEFLISEISRAVQACCGVERGDPGGWSESGGHYILQEEVRQLARPINNNYYLVANKTLLAHATKYICIDAIESRSIELLHSLPEHIQNYSIPL